MAGGYGVLRGNLDRWVREDGQATPHLQVRVLEASGQPWRVAVNVQSDTGSEVVYWLVDPLREHPVLTGLDGLPSGYSLAAASPHSALDYVRGPFFDWASGTALPASGSASADDLQDLLSLHLQHCKDAGGEIFAFGDRFDSNRHLPIDAQFGNTDGLHGIHNIHLNQGNTGRHASENRPFQDGGVILAHPDRHVGLFLAFQTQRVPTDASGKPTPQSQLIADLIAPVTPGSAGEPVYLERALVNPAGDDVGKETVVVGNLTNAPVSLQGWRLVDRNQHVTQIAALTLDPGASELIQLDGSGVQLGNAGGNLLLLNPEGRQVDAVVYTTTPSATENRYTRFNR